MKSKILLLSAFFLALTMFHPVKAKADIISDIINALTGNNNNNNNNQGTNLPINSGVVYLMVAGIAIGVVAVKKARSAKAGIVKA